LNHHTKPGENSKGLPEFSSILGGLDAFNLHISLSLFVKRDCSGSATNLLPLAFTFDPISEAPNAASGLSLVDASHFRRSLIGRHRSLRWQFNEADTKADTGSFQ
jgi:hypothetical protein